MNSSLNRADLVSDIGVGSRCCGNSAWVEKTGRAPKSHAGANRATAREWRCRWERGMRMGSGASLILIFILWCLIQSAKIL